MPQILERPSRRHDRNSFDCGVPILNGWLQHQSGQFDRRDLARTYILCAEGSSTIQGYFSLSSRSIDVSELPVELSRGLPSIDIPTILIGRLAVDLRFRGQGYGRLLLADALRRSVEVSNAIGVRGVQVDALDERAAEFYRHFGFLSLKADPLQFVIPMHDIRKLRLT